MKTYIIGEMAWSHMGDIEIAIKILEGIKSSGANATGIHITDMPSLMTKSYKCIAGQTLSESANAELSIYDYLDKYNTREDDWLKFNKIAEKLGVDLVAMCCGMNSFEFSKKMNIKKYVIPAGAFLDFEFIRATIEYCDDIILRIGGATLDEIDRVVEFINDLKPDTRINLLAGIQLYPTPIDQLHFASIQTLKDRYKNRNVTLGTADHIAGDHPFAKYLPGIAVAYGVETIEKHITTKFSERREDYEAALGIEDFKTFVEFIRNVETSLGDTSLNYLINGDYKRYKDIVRKRIVSSARLERGTVIRREHLTFKRSDYGEHLDQLENILGKELLVDLNVDEGINLKDLK